VFEAVMTFSKGQQIDDIALLAFRPSRTPAPDRWRRRGRSALPAVTPCGRATTARAGQTPAARARQTRRWTTASDTNVDCRAPCAHVDARTIETL
jgi:hypothetical protein